MKSLLLMLLLVTYSCSANVQAKAHQHHSYMGYHGMALIMSKHDGLLAYHLPLYRAPHDYQLLYQIRVSVNVKTQLGGLESMTILPEAFDLQLLIDGTRVELNVDFYEGHFERGGKKLFTAPVIFEKQKFKRQLVTLAKPSNTAKFELVSLPSGNSLAIHHITARPSFDLIVALDKPDWQNQTGWECERELEKEFSTKSLNSLAKGCFGVRPTYMEFLDFK